MISVDREKVARMLGAEVQAMALGLPPDVLADLAVIFEVLPESRRWLLSELFSDFEESPFREALRSLANVARAAIAQEGGPR